MPNPSKYTASRKANLAAAKAAIEQNSDQKVLDKTLLESQAKLHNAQQQIASLESALSDKVAACSELSMSLQEADMRSEEHLSQLAEQKARYQSLYKELRLERQWAKRACTKKGNLEQQISLLKAAAFSQSHELKNMSVKTQTAINSLLQLESQNSTLKNKLSQCMKNLQTEMHHCQDRLNVVQKKLSDSQNLSSKLKKQVNRAKEIRKRAVANAQQKQQKLSAVHHLLHKGVYTETTRNLVRFLVKAGCSRHCVNDVIHAVLKSAGITTIGTISRTTVSHIIAEGYVAAQIQLGYELGNTDSMYPLAIQIMLHHTYII
jgi:chromosome segregation ATPase